MNRRYSLKRSRDFQYVYRKGKSYGSHLMVLLVAPSREALPRVGFSVSKKVGNSVVRNRVKRRMKESFRVRLPKVKPHVALVFVARPDAAQAEYKEIAKTMQYLMKKAGLWDKERAKS